MLSLKLNRKSWHYWIATKLGWKESSRVYNYEKGRYENIYSDFCSYVRRIFFGSLGVLIGGSFALAGLLMILFAMGGTLGWLISGIFYGFYDIRGPEGAGLAIWMALSMFGMIYSITKGWIRLPRLRRLRLPACEDIPYCEDTKRFIVATYSMLHDKVCFKLEFHTGETNGNNAETNNAGNQTERN